MDIFKRHLSDSYDRDKWKYIQNIRYLGYIKEYEYQVYSFFIQVGKNFFYPIIFIKEIPDEAYFYEKNIDYIDSIQLQNEMNAIFDDDFELMSIFDYSFLIKKIYHNKKWS